MVSVNLSEIILAAVLRSAALCIRLRSILLKWFVTTVLTLPTRVLQTYRIFYGFSVTIQRQFFHVFQFFVREVKYFYQKKHLKEFASHIHLVKMI